MWLSLYFNHICTWVCIETAFSMYDWCTLQITRLCSRPMKSSHWTFCPTSAALLASVRCLVKGNGTSTLTRSRVHSARNPTAWPVLSQEAGYIQQGTPLHGQYSHKKQGTFSEEPHCMAHTHLLVARLSEASAIHGSD